MIDSILASLNQGNITSILIVAVLAIIVLLLLTAIVRLGAALIRLGCLVLVLALFAYVVIRMFGS